MKIPELFTPKKGLEKKMKSLLKKKEDNIPFEGLVIAVKAPIYDDESICNDIYAWKPGMEKPLMVRERNHGLVKLCFYNGRLFDSAGKQIYDTLDDYLISKRDVKVFGLCTHQDNLIDINKQGEIFETLSNVKVNDIYHTLTAVCSCKKKLFFGGIRNVYDQTGEIIVSRNSSIPALCCHEEELYDGSYSLITNTFTNKQVANRPSWINAICTYKNTLIDGGDYYGVYDTFTNEEIFHFDSWVTSIESIPVSFVDKLLPRK